MRGTNMCDHVWIIHTLYDRWIAVINQFFKLPLMCSFLIGANMVRGVAGAGVLAGFDKFKQMYVYLRTEYK